MMSTKNSKHRELATGQAGKKNLQSHRRQRIIETPKSILRYFVTTREQLDTRVLTTRMCSYPHEFISDRKLQRQWAHRVLGLIAEYRRDLPLNQAIVRNAELSGRK